MLLLPQGISATVVSKELNLIEPNFNSTTTNFYQTGTQEWWKWFLGIEADPKEGAHPFLDMTGEHCSINQDASNIWFLSGTDPTLTGNTEVKKECDIPSGKFILLPILNWECSGFENPQDVGEEKQINCSKTHMKGAGDLVLRYGNTTLREGTILDNFGVDTPGFNVTFPKHAIYPTSQSGTTTAAGFGYWAAFEPPAVGKHVINFGGIFDTQDPNNKMRINTTYTINVIPSVT